MRRDIHSLIDENKKLSDENNWLRNQADILEKRYKTFVNSGLFVDEETIIRGEEPFPTTIDGNSIILDCTFAPTSTEEAISVDASKN